MRFTRRMPHRFAVLLLAAVFGVNGCSQTTRVVTPAVVTPPPPPVADSPAAAVELLRWSHVNRSLDVYRTLFTEDFRFVFSVLDSTGNAYRLTPWSRADELIYAQRLFVGGCVEPPASSIILTYGNTPTALPDTRPGKNPRWHKQVSMGVVMVAQRTSSDFELKGDVRFYVVRGDSARIPDDLGASPDSTRWYIEAWEDNTLQSPAANAAVPATPLEPQPTASRSWGWLKVLYRTAASAAPAR